MKTLYLIAPDESMLPEIRQKAGLVVAKNREERGGSWSVLPPTTVAFRQPVSDSFGRINAGIPVAIFWPDRCLIPIDPSRGKSMRVAQLMRLVGARA